MHIQKSYFHQIIMYVYQFFIFLAIRQCVAVSYPELKMLNVIFRHGDRKPDHHIGGDLTIAGRQRAYRLGKTLREKYGDFLGAIYEPDAVYARSTEYARAKMSLQLLFAAIYPPREHQRWHKSLDWQPIPFSYAPVNRDLLLFPTSCPRFKREAEKVELSTEFQKLLDPYRELMKNMTVSTGKDMNSAYDMFILYHSLLSKQAENETLPQWAEEVLDDGLLLNGTYLEYRFLKFTDWMRKVNGGTLLRKMLRDMENKTDEEYDSRQKIFLYSGHELNIIFLLQTLKVWEPHIPEYSSAVIIELRENRKIYYVKVLYSNGAQMTFKEMQIPGCSSLCPLSRFAKLLSDQLPSDGDLKCEDKTLSLDEL